MESHKQLRDAGYDVKSFGTGSAVRLPGPSIKEPNVYSFGTPYEDIYQDLLSQPCRKLYESQGLIEMLDRNRHIKDAPEKWHTNYYAGKFNLVITCEERCFDLVLEDLEFRLYDKPSDADTQVRQLVHVINIDIKDDNENAILGGKGILRLVNMIHEFRAKTDPNPDDPAGNILEDQMMDILTEWQKEHPHLQTLYAVSYY